MDFKSLVVYQIYPQSFKDSNNDGIGDILGIVSKLDYLQYLGINAIWICPMYKSPLKDNGYDVSDYYSFQNNYGSNSDFDFLIKEAHKRDIKIIMDLVLNHTSNEHDWFIESQKDRNNPMSDWYIWKDPVDGKEPTNWGAMFGGPAWTYCESRKQYYFHTFSKYQPDLNWESKSLKEEIFNVAKYWIGKGVDGFRLDAINFISKDTTWKNGVICPPQKYANIYEFAANGPKLHTYLMEFKQNVLDKYDVFTVGEASSSTVEDAILFSEEIGLIFQFEHLCFDNSDWPYGQKKIDLVELKNNFIKWQNGLFGIGWNTLLWENHDQPRVVNRFQINELYREDGAKMLGACMYFMQGTPFIYQGQELGVDNIIFNNIEEASDIEAINVYHDFVDNGKLTKEDMLHRISNKSRATSRGPMLWDDSLYSGFSTNKPWTKLNDKYKTVNVKEQINRENSCLNFYRQILSLRKQYTVIQDGAFIVNDINNQNVFEYERKNDKESIVVICNFKDEYLSYNMEKLSDYCLILNNKKGTNYHQLEPYQSLVFYKKY